MSGGGIMLYKKKLIYFLLGLLFLTECSNHHKDDELNNRELLLYTSVYPIQFVTEQIAGDVATVKSIYPPGVDAHTYEPTTKEITAIANANAFIFIGGGMESFAKTAAEALRSQHVHLVELSSYSELFLTSNKKEAVNEANLDPHIWLNRLRMVQIGEIIKDVLIELSPQNEEKFTHNFLELKEELTKLDESFESTLMSKEQKEVLVTHAAYGYWENRYGIEQIAISGLSSSDEPSQKELANIARFALDKDIHYVLFEQTSSSRIGTIIQEYIQAEKLYIHQLEVLTEEDIKNNETYLTLMYKNLDMLDKATK